MACGWTAYIAHKNSFPAKGLMGVVPLALRKRIREPLIICAIRVTAMPRPSRKAYRYRYCATL